MSRSDFLWSTRFVYIPLRWKCASPIIRYEMNSLLFSTSSSKLHTKCRFDLLSVGFNSCAYWILYGKQFKSHFRINLKELMNIWNSKDHVGFERLFSMLSCSFSVILSFLTDCGPPSCCASATVPSLWNLETHHMVTCCDGALWKWNILL